MANLSDGSDGSLITMLAGLATNTIGLIHAELYLPGTLLALGTAYLLKDATEAVE